MSELSQLEDLARVRIMAANGGLLRLFEQAGLSSQDIGLAIGASRQNVHRWLHGDHPQDRRICLAMAELVRRIQAIVVDVGAIG